MARITKESQNKLHAAYDRLSDSVTDFAAALEHIALYETWNDDVSEFYEELHKISDRVTTAKRKLYELDSKVEIIQQCSEVSRGN